MLSPLQVSKIEKLRKYPYSRMFGCCEWEKIAEAIVEHLAKTDSPWDAEFNFYDATVMIEDLMWCDDHGHHGHEGTFQETYIENGRVTQRFIDNVTRKDDGTEFKPEVMDAICHLWELLG